MDFPNNDNFGIDEIKLDQNSDVIKNDVIEAQRNTGVTSTNGGQFEGSVNSDGNVFSLNKSNFDLKHSAHPVACVFTVVFKALAVLM